MGGLVPLLTFPFQLSALLGAVEEDRESRGVQEREERESWRDTAMAAKTLTEL